MAKHNIQHFCYGKLNAIGNISGANWVNAPEGATHVRSDNAGWYRYDCATELYLLSSRGEDRSMYASVEDFNSAGGAKLISKEEDLGMNTKEVSKQVSCIEDLEVGMFFKTDMSHILITSEGFGKVCGLCVKSGMAATYTTDGFTCLRSWSYTYAGEYTPIVKETEAEIKIRELEATIALAQKQLQEYKGMK